MSFFTYAVPAGLGLIFSFMGIIFAMTAGHIPYVEIGLLILAYAGTITYIIGREKIGKGAQSAYLLILPMFMVSGVEMAFHYGKYAIDQLTPDSETFIAECKTTGVNFFKPPSSPVQSIAYDWDGKIEPPYIQFKVDGTRMTSFSYTNIPIDAGQGVDYVEKKTSYERNTEQTPAFVKYTSPGKSSGIAALTADVLVHYRLTPEDELKKAYPYQELVRYELTITDRRTGEKLASKLYFVDAKKRRACGPSGNDRSFILKAIGKQ